jgi:hypothetical protein
VADAGVHCQVLPDGATVETGDSDYEPHALVNCGEPMADAADGLIGFGKIQPAKLSLIGRHSVL